MKKTLIIALAFILTQSAAAQNSKGDKMLLDNGLTVILNKMPSNGIASVQVWVKVGSINEDEKTNGLSHFLEHLIFKGSKNYPGNEISRIVETQGGVINAATSKEFTYFYIDTQSQGLPDAIKILADSMANIALPVDELEKERPVVLEEIARHSDNPGQLIYDDFCKAVFPDSAYNKTILGSSDVIKNISRDEIIAYYKTYYVPKNMFLTIAGDFDKDQTLKLIKETFGRQEKKNAPKPANLVQKEHKPIIIKQEKDVEQTYSMAGFLGPDITSDEQFAADITGTILGGLRSSRLYQNLREKNEVVYSISSSYWSQRGTGTMAISCVFNPKNEKKVITDIEKEIEALMEYGPDEDELFRAKEVIKSQWIFGLETCHEVASINGYWHMQGNPGIIDRYIEGISKITKQDVIDFLNKYYKTGRLSYAIIAPKK